VIRTLRLFVCGVFGFMAGSLVRVFDVPVWYTVALLIGFFAYGVLVAADS
jgi:hypothetical protein